MILKSLLLQIRCGARSMQSIRCGKETNSTIDMALHGRLYYHGDMPAFYALFYTTNDDSRRINFGLRQCQDGQGYLKFSCEK